MVSAELNHNPYLLQTDVKFNGNEPRINSQIEKYEKLPLKDWGLKVPEIFYNEMNGYDFDLYFIGTQSDFNELQNAFKIAGVTREEVRLFHKNELEDADVKYQELLNLMEWLNNHRNRRFEYDEFLNEYGELLECSFPYVIIRGEHPKKNADYISIENISNVKELDSAILTSTPILFYINDNSTKQFRSDLDYILSRKDIRKEQLFFRIHPLLDKKQLTRVISDLGVENPQVIEQSDDELVMRYIFNYPMTEYVREAIRIFDDRLICLKDILDEENNASQRINQGIYTRITELEQKIQYLKDADLK